MKRKADTATYPPVASPGKPLREAERLAALRCLGILDTPPSETFDRITALAAKLLSVPVALVSLVDESRQWFKSRVGMDATETAREVSFCAHAVCSGSVLNVPDASQDPRFAENPLVTGAPKIRAYLGVPLCNRDGFALGTLCAIDMKPRHFNDEDIKHLSSLAKLIEDSIHSQELAASTEAMLRLAREQETLFRDTFEQAAVGIVHTGLTGQLLRINQRICKMLGYTEDEMREISFFKITHADDLEKNLELFRSMVAGKVDSYEMDKRYLCKSGVYLWTHLTVSLKRLASGEPDYMIAVIEDIGERKRAEGELLRLKETLEYEVAQQTHQLTRQARELRTNNIQLAMHVQRALDSERAVREIEQRLRAITDNVPALIGYWNLELKCEFANIAHLDLFGKYPKSILGMTMRDLMGKNNYDLVQNKVRLALAGHAQWFEMSFTRFDGFEADLEVRYIPDFDSNVKVRGLYLFVTDVTDPRRGQKDVGSSAAKLFEGSAADCLLTAADSTKSLHGKHIAAERKPRRTVARL